MIRRTARWSVRLGVVAAVALVIKKLVDSQREEPQPIRNVEPPAPRPKPSPPRPTPVVPPRPAPAPVAEAPAPAPPPAPAVEVPTAPPASDNGSAKARHSEPLKAKRLAERMERPVRANRGIPASTEKVPRSQMVSWIEPLDGVCPTSHPIKAKLGSKVFRKPGMTSYESSKPDRCYASEGAARRAGFTEAQR